MRFRMRRSYAEDFALFKWRSSAVFYTALSLVLLALPAVSGSYTLYLLNLIGIYTIVAVGLQLLTGCTGLVSLGHAAFFSLGAYGSAILTSSAGLTFWVAVPLAGAITGLIGCAVGLPALRVKGLYLALATMAFAAIVEQVVLQWETLTHGVRGMTLLRPRLGPLSLGTDWAYYYLVLAAVGLAVWGARNLLRSPSGRALVAIRESEIAAQTMGISLARFKVAVFGVSAAYTGIAGALFGHFMKYIGPESFTLMDSIGFVVMIVIGGLASLQGAVLGAAFVGLLPEAIRLAKDFLPAALREQAGIQPIVYALALILSVMYEPGGMYGRWLKMRRYLETFPYYRKETFKRERRYYRAERSR